MKMCWVVAIFLIGAVGAVPAQQANPEKVPVTEVPREYSKECREAYAREPCSKIFDDAVAGGSGLRSSFQNYCRKIPAYVPCLENNKQVYMTLLGCSRALEDLMTLLTPEGMWDMTIDLHNTANDIACSRTDELIDLIECVQRRGGVFQPKLHMCMQQHQNGTIFGPMIGGPFEMESFNRSSACSSIYGFTGCMKDVFVEICGSDVRDVVDTIYDDVVVGVIGEALHCNEEINPFLLIRRALRDKFRR